MQKYSLNHFKLLLNSDEPNSFQYHSDSEIEKALENVRIIPVDGMNFRYRERTYTLKEKENGNFKVFLKENETNEHPNKHYKKKEISDYLTDGVWQIV